MRLTIGNYEVEIKAKGKGNNRFNAEDTKALLNLLSSANYNGSEFCKEHGWETIAEDEANMASDIYDALDATRYYDSVKARA